MTDRNYSTKGNNKGLTCPFKPITCQEGYCLDCLIGQNAVPEAIRATVEATPEEIGSMTLQAKIQEGVAKWLPMIWQHGVGGEPLSQERVDRAWDNMKDDKKFADYWIHKAGFILAYLHSDDVAIKVKSELPELVSKFYLDGRITKEGDLRKFAKAVELETKTVMLKAGYKATVPLIEEVKDDNTNNPRAIEGTG